MTKNRTRIVQTTDVSGDLRGKMRQNGGWWTQTSTHEPCHKQQSEDQEGSLLANHL